MDIEEKIKYHAVYKMLTKTIPKELLENEQAIGMSVVEDDRDIIAIHDGKVHVVIEIDYY
jgi:hypothetical protein